MTRLDMRAQAGQVQGVIGRLQPDAALWIRLAYGPADELVKCACEMVTYVIGRLPTGGYERRVIADLILWNCGRREVQGISLRPMAQRGEMSVWKLQQLGKKVGQIMQDIGVRAFEDLEHDFSDHSWLKKD
jgi:hypothetical protein